jgi:hypothetical protein
VTSRVLFDQLTSCTSHKAAVSFFECGSKAGKGR